MAERGPKGASVFPRVFQRTQNKGRKITRQPQEWPGGCLRGWATQKPRLTVVARASAGRLSATPRHPSSHGAAAQLTHVKEILKQCPAGRKHTWTWALPSSRGARHTDEPMGCRGLTPRPCSVLVTRRVHSENSSTLWCTVLHVWTQQEAIEK